MSAAHADALRVRFMLIEQHASRAPHADRVARSGHLLLIE
jgi:hypothetical protein